MTALRRPNRLPGLDAFLASSPPNNRFGLQSDINIAPLVRYARVSRARGEQRLYIARLQFSDTDEAMRTQDIQQ